MRTRVAAGAVVEAAVVSVIGDGHEPVRRAAGDLLHGGAVDPRAVVAGDFLVVQRAHRPRERRIGDVDVVVDARLLQRRVAAVARVCAGRPYVERADDLIEVGEGRFDQAGPDVEADRDGHVRTSSPCPPRF